MTSIRLMRSGLVRVLFVHVLQSRPWNALHYWPVASDKLKVGGFRFLINVHHGQYPVMALSGNAVVLPWNTECHADSLRRSCWRSRAQKFKLHHYRVALEDLFFGKGGRPMPMASQ
jgi:hypothetical protein